jgi:hypothetical protein
LKNFLSLRERVRVRDKIRGKYLILDPLILAFSLREKEQNVFSTAC